MEFFWEGFNKQASVASSVKKFFTRGLKSLPKELQRGLEVEAKKGGTPDSLFMMPLAWGAKKVVGKSKVERAMWRKIHRPATSLDTAAGNVAKDTVGRLPLLKNLFVQKQSLPVKRKGETLYKEFSRPSLTAPLSKAHSIAAPFAVAMGAEKLIKDFKGKGKDPASAASDTMQGVR